MRGTQFRTSVDRQETRLSRIEVLADQWRWAAPVSAAMSMPVLVPLCCRESLLHRPKLLAAPVIELPAEFSALFRLKSDGRKSKSRKIPLAGNR